MRNVDLNWLTRLRQQEYHQPWNWLMELRPFIRNFVSFGCMTEEPFFLMWVLDAIEAVVVEREEHLIYQRREDQENLRREIPLAFEGRTIDFVQADMTKLTENDLLSNHFDLAFCKMILYDIFLDDLPSIQAPLFRVDLERVQPSDIEQSLRKLKYAINQMARVVKLGGWVIALERIALTVGGEEIDISGLFEAAGLSRELLKNVPEYENAYCYKRLL